MSIPRRTYTTVNGVEVLTFEAWYLNGQCHRTDGPALRSWEVVGGHVILNYEGWYLNGQLHRTDEPSWRGWEVIDGRAVLIAERWYLNGQLHRTDGSALRQWRVVDGHGHEEAVLTYEMWYLKGREIHPRILRQPVRAIERWWRFEHARRQQAIEDTLWNNGMTVFPGFMGLLREY